MSGHFLRLPTFGAGGTNTRLGVISEPLSLQARLCEGKDRSLVFVVIHPSADFLDHFLTTELPKLGVGCFAINTRYVGNDTHLLMETCIQDLGAGIKYLREVQGYKRIVLVGNSGGASLVGLYQQQAELGTISSLPDGTPFSLEAVNVPPADAVALLAASPGRAHILTDWLDPAVMDEADISASNHELDMFNADHGPPYRGDWLLRYRAAQKERNDRITDLVLEALHRIDSAKDVSINDLPMIVYRTGADPRFVDTNIDYNQRSPRRLLQVKASNYSHNNMGRYSSLRSWLSQWSVRCTRAYGPECMRNTTVPVLLVEYGADEVVFPSQIQQWKQAIGSRAVFQVLDSANHFLRDQPAHRLEAAQLMVDWARQAMH
jgi:pimeloyl-ACP methyl ester carboxylesterase